MENPAGTFIAGIVFAVAIAFVARKIIARKNSSGSGGTSGGKGGTPPTHQK